MAYTLSTNFYATPSLTMKWSLLDAATNTLDGTLKNQTSGLSELGTASGWYVFYSASIPSATRGNILFHTNTLTAASDLAAATTYGALNVNPGDLEYIDTAISSRSTLTQTQVTGGAYSLQSDGSGYLKLSSGTGTGQVNLSNGLVLLAASQNFDNSTWLKVNVREIGNDTLSVANLAGAFQDGTVLLMAQRTVDRVLDLATATNVSDGTTTLTDALEAGVTVVTVEDSAITSSSFAEGTTVPRVTLVDTTTDVTNGATATALANGIDALSGAVGNATTSINGTINDLTNTITSSGVVASSLGAQAKLDVTAAVPTAVQNATAVWANGERTLTAGSAPTGVGPYPINHSGGLGAGGVAATIDLAGGTTFAAWTADLLRYTASGVGVPNLPILAYAKTSYDSVPGSGLAGVTNTKSDGRWAAPLMLASGDYYVIADRSGDGFQSDQVVIRVP